MAGGYAFLLLVVLLLPSTLCVDSDITDEDALSSGSGEPPTAAAPMPVYETYPFTVYGNLTCESYYSGGACEAVIHSTLPVWTNYSRAPQSVVKQDLDKVLYVLTVFGSSQQCFSKAVPVLCLFTFPYCDPAFTIPVYQPLCRKDCEIMRDLVCPSEWEQMQNLQGVIDFGLVDTFNCSRLSYANAGDPPMCISLFDGGVIPESVKSGPDCYTGRGRGYNGTVSTTISGNQCQMWEVPFPHRHLLSPSLYPEIKGHNYCRNPGSRGERPWCFTTNRAKRWEYCDIEECSESRPICELYKGKICKKYGSIGMNYIYSNGTDHNELESQMNKLIEALANFPTCQQSMIELTCHANFPECDLSSNVPRPRKVCTSYCQEVKETCADFYEHFYNFESVNGITSLIIPDCSSTDSEPVNGGTSPECYTPPIIPGLLKQNDDCYDASIKGVDYNGTISTTISGLSCQPWDGTAPHYHPLSSLFRRYLEEHNYCRNPDGRGQSPWCYTMDSNVRWEYCDIKECSEGREGNAPLPVYIWALIGVGVAGLVLVCLAIIILTICVMRNKSRSKSMKLSERDDLKKEVVEMKAVAITPEEDISEFIESGNLPLIKREKLVYLCDLGEGHFGKVMKAEALDVSPDHPKMPVAVKVLKEGTSHAAKKEFFREACLMNEYNHRNIVRLIGVCAQDQPLFMVFEYMEMGDLHSFLRQNAPDSTFSFPLKGPKTLPYKLSIDQMVSMCVDIAAGLDYLSSHHYIHRDLATRNCLVNNDLCVKISDFGMSQDIYVSDYFRLGDSEMLPIRWMPPEAIMFSTFSTESDVWSFGVVLWEIFSYGMQPYYGMSNEQVVQYVKECKTMDKPEKCPQEIYDLMLDCWVVDPKERPTANQIYQGLRRWTPELSAQVKRESQPTIVKETPEYQNMSTILQWAAATDPTFINNPNYTLLEEIEDDNLVQDNGHVPSNDQRHPAYDKLAPL